MPVLPGAEPFAADGGCAGALPGPGPTGSAGADGATGVAGDRLPPEGGVDVVHAHTRAGSP